MATDRLRETETERQTRTNKRTDEQTKTDKWTKTHSRTRTDNDRKKQVQISKYILLIGKYSLMFNQTVCKLILSCTR